MDLGEYGQETFLKTERQRGFLKSISGFLQV
jgi:hypothetical protein